MKPKQYNLLNKHPLIAVLFCLAAFTVFGYVIFSSHEPSRPTVVQKPTFNKMEVLTEAQMQILKYLTSPSTAKFGHVSDSIIENVSDKRYRVASTVDSQNGFGAMVRTSFVVDFTYLTNDQIKINQIIINGKDVMNNL